MSATAHHHTGHHGSRDIEQPLDVGVDHLVPVFNFAGVELVHAAAEPRIVDQHIDLRPLGG